MNHHPRIDAAAALQQEAAHHEAVLRRHSIRLIAFLATCILAVGAAHLAAWQGITVHVVK